MPECSRAVENESGLVDEEERITLFVSVTMACIRYVEISVRSSVSVSGDFVGNGRESKQTGDFGADEECTAILQSSTPANMSRRGCMSLRKARAISCYFTVELDLKGNLVETHHL